VSASAGMVMAWPAMPLKLRVKTAYPSLVAPMTRRPGTIGLSAVDRKLNWPLALLPVDQVCFASSCSCTSACAIGAPVAMSFTIPLTDVTWFAAAGDGLAGGAATALIVSVWVSELGAPLPLGIEALMVMAPETAFVLASFAVTCTDSGV